MRLGERALYNKIIIIICYQAYKMAHKADENSTEFCNGNVFNCHGILHMHITWKTIHSLVFANGIGLEVSMYLPE